MTTLFWKKASVITAVFGIFYVAIFFMSGLVVYPTDYIIELATGKEYVDGWTPGFMVWTALLFIIPVIYLILIGTLWVKSRHNS